MDAARLIESLERTSRALTGLLRDCPPEDATWKPDARTWSVAEIAGHLLEEERTDFRPRLRSTLADASVAWPAIDPEGAVPAGGYASRDLEEIGTAFLEERRASLAWLRTLSEADWSATYEHPELGPLSAGDLLTSWAAHDLLHLRQIASRLYRRIEDAGAPHTTNYAGPLNG